MADQRVDLAATAIESQLGEGSRSSTARRRPITTTSSPLVQADFEPFGNGMSVGGG
jgi:hypothetical protein